MKKILFTIAKNGAVSAALLMLMIVPFAPLVAQAQQISCSTPGADPATCTPGGSSTLPASATAAASTPAATTPPTGDSVPNLGCTLDPHTWDLCITDVVYAFTVGIGSGFAYVSAYFLDWAIALSLNGSAYALGFVSSGWTTARDVANMAFLFILLYIAFKIIFEAETTETVRMLTLVIVLALLVNFSFFFTRLVIDAGNILSIQFYNAIQAPAVSASPAAAASAVTTVASSVGGASSFSNSKDLTASIMGMLNLQGLFSTASFTNWYSPGGNPAAGPPFMVVLVSLTFLYVAAGIMFWLLTVAFITNGVKFLFRIVILWFLIIASPLAFVAKAVPKFERYYGEWQDALIKNAFYPAAFMFIFLMLSNFATQMGQNNSFINSMFTGLSGSTSASPVASIGYAVANVAIRMGFVIAMLYIGMEAAKRVGVVGADAANHAGNWVGGKMIATYSGVGRFAGQNTLGRAANTVGQSAWVNRRAEAEERSGRGSLWQGVLRAAKGSDGKGGLAGASFDLRNAPGASALLTKIGAGSANKTISGKPLTEGGYAGQQKSIEDKLARERKERAAIIRDERNRKIMERVLNNVKSGKEPTKEDKDAVKTFTKGDMERAKDKGTDIEALVPFFSEGQMKAMRDSDKFTDTEKARSETIWQKEAGGAPNQKANEVLKKLEEIDTDLRAAGTAGSPAINISAFNPSGGNNSITKVGNLVDETKVQAALKEVESAIDELKSKIDTLARVPANLNMRIDLNHKLTALQNAKSKINDFEKERKDTPKIENRASRVVLVNPKKTP